MHVGVLGPLEIVDEGRRVALAGTKERALLAMLAIHAGQVVSEARLIDALWGDVPPRTATKTLQTYVMRLRKTLGRRGPDDLGAMFIETRPPGYMLRGGTDTVDSRTAARMLAEGRASSAAGDHETAAKTLSAALELWRGPSLEEFAGLPFAVAEAARLEELRQVVLEEQLDAQLALGSHRQCIAELEALVSVHPLRERLWGQLMIALYRSGRQGEALRAFQRARSTLVDELGIEPGPELRRLERAVIDQDPALDGPGTGATPGRGLPASEPTHLPVGMSPVAGTIFVGRQDYMTRLTAAWEAATGGRRQFVLLAGEPGMGKTTMARVLAGRVHAGGGTVLHGRATEEIEVPYQPFGEALRAYVRDLGTDELSARVGSLGGDLARLVPELPVRLPGLPAPIRADPEAERYRLFEAASSFLAATAARQTTLLVLDDLQWAGTPSLLLLRHLLRANQMTRLLVVATYRDTEVGVAHPLSEILPDLHREPAVMRLNVSGLSEAEAVELVALRAGQDLREREVVFARALHAETAGNPFFLDEILRHLVETGEIYRQGGRWTSVHRADQLDLPDGVREVIGQRLSRLPESAHRALTVAAVVGGAFSLELLELLPEAADDPDSLLDALDEAVIAQVLAETPGRPGHYTFAHALTRQVVCGRLTSARQARLHRRVGEALERLPGADSDPGLLAHHFASAGDSGKASGYALRAGMEAIDQLAFEPAVDHLERGIEWCDAVQPPDLTRRTELFAALADARRRAGDLVGAKEASLRSAADARMLGSASHLAEAAILHAALGVAGRRDPAVAALCEEALQALGPAPSAPRARVLARLTLHRALWESEGVAAGELGQQALDLAREVDDAEAVQAALFARALTLFGSEHVDQRLTLAEELTSMAGRAGDVGMQARGLRVRALARLELGDIAGFDADLTEVQALGTQLRHWTYLSEAARWLVLRALLDGRYSEVEDRIAEMVGHAGHDLNSRNARACQRFFLLRDLGRTADARPLAVAAGEEMPGLLAFQALVALADAERGEIDAARAGFEELAASPPGAEDFSRMPRDFTWTASMSSLTGVCTALEDTERAAVLLRLFSPHAGRLVVVGWGDVSAGAVDRYLGMLTTTLGQWDRAEAHYERALALETHVGSAPFLARTRTAYAGMLFRRSRPGDGGRAAELLTGAIGDARRLGMGGVLAEAESLLAG